MENLDIKRDINNIMKQLKNSDFQKEVTNYIDIRNTIDKVKIRTIRNDVQALLTLDKYFSNKKINYKAVNTEQMLKWEKYLETDLGLSSSSITLYEIHIKRFYKYLTNKKEYMKGKRFQKNIPYPDNVVWISGFKENGKSLPISRIITHEEILQMLNICDNQRDQAMIVTFFDCGLRNSELIGLNVENLGFDKLGAFVILPDEGASDLKTGQRKIRYFLMPSSSKYMKDYINNHPFKQYDKAPLFYSRDIHFYPGILKKANKGTISQKDFNKLRLHRLSVKDIIKRIGGLSDVPIKKPHDLRHNSCTWCAKAGFNEAELRVRYGWSPTSKMPSRYTHLASKDIDDKIKILTGFKEPDKPDKNILQPVLCWNCNEENVPTNKFCSLCGYNLKPSKEEITGLKASDLGVAIQKGMNPEQVEEITKQVLVNLLKEYDLKKKE